MRGQSSKRVVLLAFALALGTTACAAGAGGGSRAAGSSSTRIVEAELLDLGQVTALQAIERLRPRWLQSRAGISGAAPVLYVDGGRRGDSNELASIRASDVAQMEYMSPSDATTRFGTGHTGGAIMVTTKR